MLSPNRPRLLAELLNHPTATVRSSGDIASAALRISRAASVG